MCFRLQIAKAGLQLSPDKTVAHCNCGREQNCGMQNIDVEW